jgi:hypothetical protein
VVLHGDERCPAVPFRHPLRLRELPRVHAAGAEVARLAGADHVVQRLHRLLDRRMPVPAMDLVQVDVVQAEPSERGVDRREDVLAREAAAVRARRHLEVDLGRDHELVAGEQLRQEAAGDDLASTLRVHVGRVEEGDPALDGAPDDRLGGGLVQHPGTRGGPGVVAHHPEAHARDVQADCPQSHLLHPADPKRSCPARGGAPRRRLRARRRGPRRASAPAPGRSRRSPSRWRGAARS